MSFLLKNKLVARSPAFAGLRGKNNGGKRTLPGDPALLPQNGAGRSGAGVFLLTIFFP
jgi:hypothetical protein